jgi:DNA-binding phage protein
MEKLANPDRVASYLNAALQDSTESFLIALGKVAQANRMSRVVQEAEGATLDALSAILKAMGLRIEIGREGTANASPPPIAILGNDPSFAGRQTLEEEPQLHSETRF